MPKLNKKPSTADVRSGNDLRRWLDSASGPSADANAPREAPAPRRTDESDVAGQPRDESFARRASDAISKASQKATKKTKQSVQKIRRTVSRTVSSLAKRTSSSFDPVEGEDASVPSASGEQGNTMDVNPTAVSQRKNTPPPRSSMVDDLTHRMGELKPTNPRVGRHVRRSLSTVDDEEIDPSESELRSTAHREEGEQQSATRTFSRHFRSPRGQLSPPPSPRPTGSLSSLPSNERSFTSRMGDDGSTPSYTPSYTPGDGSGWMTAEDYEIVYQMFAPPDGPEDSSEIARKRSWDRFDSGSGSSRHRSDSSSTGREEMNTAPGGSGPS